MKIVGDEAPTEERVRERYRRLLERLRARAADAGRDPDRLRVVAVTKTWPVEVARTAVAAGITRLGESRVQEAEPKVAAIQDAEWHFIGRLQSNKARRVVRGFSVIHSVDSLDLLRRVVELAAGGRHRPELLVQVNVSGEAAKAGFAPETVLGREVVESIRQAGVAGLMTIAPMGVVEDEARAHFARLRELRDRLSQATGLPLLELSMGMTADADAAAAEGATLVRIGTGLFGPRPETLLSSQA